MAIYTDTPHNPGRFACPHCMDEVPIKCLPCDPEPGEDPVYYPVCDLCGCEDLQEIEED